ncbi:MAG: TRAP transporter large permease subunit, partial [Burkholderiales bacterium]
ITGADTSPMMVLVIILVIFVILGCVLESLSMILLMVPIFFPVVAGLDLGIPPKWVLVWFGVIVVMITEISLITPPVGLNVYVLSSVLPEVSTTTIFRGMLPFITVDILRLALFVAVPWISLALPRLFYG